MDFYLWLFYTYSVHIQNCLLHCITLLCEQNVIILIICGTIGGFIRLGNHEFVGLGRILGVISVFFSRLAIALFMNMK